MLPAGLIDKNIELFADGDSLKAIWQGSVVDFSELPSDTKDIYLAEMLTNNEAIKCLYDLGIKHIDAMLEKYCWCRYGGFDKTPDLITETGDTTSEYWNCGQRETCPYQFVLCDKVRIDNIYLTRRQVEIVRLIAEGLPDKISTDKLGISINTFLAHKKEIYYKLGINSQTELTAIAFRNGLIE